MTVRGADGGPEQSYSVGKQVSFGKNDTYAIGARDIGATRDNLFNGGGVKSKVSFRGGSSNMPMGHMMSANNAPVGHIPTYRDSMLGGYYRSTGGMSYG